MDAPALGDYLMGRPGVGRPRPEVKILHFLTREADAPRHTILAMAALSGMANGLLIELINRGAALVPGAPVKAALIGAYVGAFIVYVLAQRYALTRAVAAVELALQGFRLRVMDRVRRADLRFIEEHGGLGTFAPLTDDAGLISQGVVTLVAAAQSVLVLFVAGIYLGLLSPVTLLVTAAIYALLLPVLASRRQQTRDELAGAAAQDGLFFERFAGIISGFKELKLNRPESDALFADICRGANCAYLLKQATSTRQVQNMIYGYSLFFVVLLAAVFVIPTFVDEAGDTVHKVTATILFMMTPLGPMIAAAPLMARIDSAVSRLYALEDRMDSAADSAEAGPPPPLVPDFQRIELAAVTFHYADAHGRTLFAVGPFDLTLGPGELVFIVGGNGSGKSTLLKLLTGLYRPEQGEVRLDGRLVLPPDYPRYRTLFAGVFTDFHLFPRLYGGPDLDPRQVNDWLAELGLAEKTRYTAAGFTNLELSTGQRKRVAIVAAILKGRPVCILDEPAADQDPEFRRRFYEQVLPALKAAGRTLVVVSHDDRYFHLADRVLHLRDGRIESCVAGAGAAAAASDA